MATNPTLLAMPLAENGTKNVIPETQATPGNGLFSQSTGFPAETSLPLGAGGVAPKREDFNGVFNLLSDIAFYAQKGWVFKWDENQAYFVGCEVIDETDGFKYRCIQDVAAGGDAPSDDGAVHWRLVIEGEYIGSIKPCLQTSIPDGWLSCENGQEVSRTAYPELWAWVQDNAPLITEAQWQTKASAQKSVGYYSSGDGSTTFRLPRLVGFMEGVPAANVGQFTGAGLPNITGSTLGINIAPGTGAFQSGTAGTTGGAYPPQSGSFCIDDFDASRSSSIYGNSNTVQPESVGMVWCVRAFGAAVNQGTVDITELAQMLNLKLSISDAPRICTPFAFPSDTYINITSVFNTNLATYTAPADGYVQAAGESTAAGAVLTLTASIGAMSAVAFLGWSLDAWVPVRKGQTVTLSFSNAGNVSSAFYYAVGEEP